MLGFMEVSGVLLLGAQEGADQHLILPRVLAASSNLPLTFRTISKQLAMNQPGLIWTAEITATSTVW